MTDRAQQARELLTKLRAYLADDNWDYGESFGQWIADIDAYLAPPKDATAWVIRDMASKLFATVSADGQTVTFESGAYHRAKAAEMCANLLKHLASEIPALPPSEESKP